MLVLMLIKVIAIAVLLSALGAAALRTVRDD